MRLNIGKALVLGAVSLSLIYGLWPEPLYVSMTEVAKGPLTVLIKEEGQTRIIDRYVISAPTAGYARRIDLEIGDKVNEGQMVVEIEPMQASILDPRSKAKAIARVNAAKSALEVDKENVDLSRSQLDLTRLEYERKTKLIEDGTISQGNLDTAIAALKAAQARFRSAKFAVEGARFELQDAQSALEYSGLGNGSGAKDRLQVRSPIQGSVLKVHHESEGVVKASEPLLDVGDPAALEVVVDVLSQDAVRIKKMMKVLIKHWGGEEVLEGRVKRIEPVGYTKISALGVEEQRVWIIISMETEYEKWLKLGDAYRVESHFVIWEESEVLQIPSSSVFRIKDDFATYVVENSKARIARLKLGQSNGLQTQILSGLKGGEQIITFPDKNIYEGVKVKSKSNNIRVPLN